MLRPELTRAEGQSERINEVIAMNTQQMRRMRMLLTALVMLAELLHLAWEFTHGGVKSHHLLNQADMPAITNWWGILLLPALAWFLLGRIEGRRLSNAEDLGRERKISVGVPVGILAGVVGSLLYGIALAVAFTQHAEAIASYLFLGMFLAALLLPVYRPEYILGFILGMTFTFGAVLPTFVSLLIAGVSAALHLLIYPLIRFIFTRRFALRRSI